MQGKILGSKQGLSACTDWQSNYEEEDFSCMQQGGQGAISQYSIGSQYYEQSQASYSNFKNKYDQQ